MTLTSCVSLLKPSFKSKQCHPHISQLSNYYVLLCSRMYIMKKIHELLIWTLFEQLDDLDFADDLALLVHNQNQMQDKTCRLETFSAKTGLKINLRKTELIKINTTAITPIAVGGEPSRKLNPLFIWAAPSPSKVEQMKMLRQE